MARDVRGIETRLESGGLRPAEASFLVRLGELGEATSGELQSALGLPQSRVCRLARRLEGSGWVRVGVVKRLAVGRPAHVYRLDRPLPEIVEELHRRAERASRLRTRELPADRRRANRPAPA